jgi:NDP-sugar pyrophosphorylase family protein
MHKSLEEIDVVILCGGQGMRLRPITKNQPKVLVDVGGRAFLDILICNILQYGVKRLILSVGYLKEQIIDHFKNNITNYRVEFSEEEIPLGTGGAVKRARHLVKSNSFLVMNGDSFCKVDLTKFYSFHIKQRAVLSMVLVRSRQTDDYGMIELDDSYRVKSFREKAESRGSGLISAGIYLMKRDIFSLMPDDEVFSLEYDFFPKVLDNECYGFVYEGELIDIGTPDRYERAKKLFLKS